jgi:hypothetical protein
MFSGRSLNIVSLFVVLAGLAAVSLWKPGTSVFLPPCPFHALLGLFCPGCGSTRMVYYLVHGELITSFRQNPLAFVFLPFVAVKLVSGVLPPRFQVSFAFIDRIIPPRHQPMVLLVVVIAFTVLRNIPIWPACTLAPGGC